MYVSFKNAALISFDIFYPSNGPQSLVECCIKSSLVPIPYRAYWASRSSRLSEVWNVKHENWRRFDSISWVWTGHHKTIQKMTYRRAKPSLERMKEFWVVCALTVTAKLISWFAIYATSAAWHKIHFTLEPIQKKVHSHSWWVYKWSRIVNAD